MALPLACQGMRKHLSLAVLLALFPLLPARADLDDADLSNKQSSTPSEKVYKAWCGVDQKDCKVKFRNGRMIVNEGSGITSAQVIELERRIAYRAKLMNCTADRWREEHGQKEYAIKYRSDSVTKSALITFVHSPTDQKFKRDLQKWIGKTITTSPN